MELATIFADLALAKGFDLDDDLTVEIIGALIEENTSHEWRSDRNGRVSEMLLAGVRTEVRRRGRNAAFDEGFEVDPHLIILKDVENVCRKDFK